MKFRCYVALLIPALGLLAMPALADQDADGIPDRQDNCLLQANPSQLDTNGDGYGNACDPDLNNDGIVDLLDLAAFRAAFLTSPGDPGYDPDVDLTGDEAVNLLDLALVRALFLQPPGPVGQVRWINPDSGDWNEEANWFPNKPIAPNFALIDTPGIVVTHDSGSNECAGILSDADIDLSGASTLTVNGDLDMQGTLTMSGSNTRLRNARITRSIPTEGALPLVVSSNSILDNITFGIDFTIDNNSSINFENGLTLDNTTLTLVSNGSFTQAIFRGTQTLGGTGEIHYAGTTTGDTLIRVVPQNSVDTLTVGAGITVRSQPAGGWLGSNGAGRGLNMLGTVIADDAGAEITVQGDPMSVSGELIASNSSTIMLDGNWTGSDSASLTAETGAELELFGSWSSEATVSVDGGLLDIGSNNTTDAWTNQGAITVTGSDVELGGVFGPSDIGNLTTSGLVLLNGRLILTGLTFDLDAAPGSWQLTTNGVIQDGTVTGTLLPVVGGGDFDGTTLAVDTVVNNNVTVDVFNGLTLDNATYTLISNGSFTQTLFRGSQTLGGTGEILYAGTTTGDTLIRVQPVSSGDILTVGPGITARTLTTGGWLGGIGAGRGLNMLGSAIADVADAILTIQGDLLAIDGASLATSNGGKLLIDGVWTASDTTTMTATDNSELELFGDWNSEADIDVTDSLLDIGNNNTTHTWTNASPGTITLVNSDAELGGVFVPDDIGATTIDGTTNLNGRLVLTGLTFDLDAAPGSWQLTTNGVIQDGTVTGTLLPVVGAGDFDGTTLAVDTELSNSVTVDVFNGLTLDNATYTLISDGSFTQTLFRGTQTLGGTGELLYAGTTTGDTLIRVQPVASGDILTVGPGITARTLTTGGWLGDNGAGRGLTMLGDAIANADGAVLTIQGDLLTIDGFSSISGSGGGGVLVDGNWIATADTTMSMNDGGTLELNGSWTSAADITVTDSFLDIGNNDTEGWDNNGSIDLIDSDASFGGLFDQASLGTLTSNGAITIDGVLDNTGQTLNIDTLPGDWTIAAGTISGGTIAGTTLEVTGNSAELDGVTLTADMVLNNATLMKLFNGLTLNNSTVTLISNGSFTQLLADGTQTIGGTGQILFSGTTTNDTVNRVQPLGSGDTLTIGSGVSVDTDTAGGFVGVNNAGRGLILQGSVTSDISGRKVQILGNTLSIAGTAAATGGGNLLINGDWDATASANISIAGGGELELFGQWVNNGTITATTGSLIDIGNNSTADTWTNLGSIDLDGADAELGGIFSFDDLGTFTSNGATIINGQLDNTGLTLDLDTAPGTWELETNGQIVGGTVAGSSGFMISGNGELNGVTLAVDTTIDNSVTSAISNGLTLDNATVTLASTGGFSIISFNGTQTLGGTGEILLGGSTTNDTVNRIDVGLNNTMLTIGPDITIETLTTGGRVGLPSTGRAVNFQGTLVADVPGKTVSLDGRPFTNNGAIVVDAGSDIVGSSDYVQGASGILQLEISGTTMAEFGNIDMTGSSTLSLNGTLDIILSGFSPSLGDMFEILGANSRSGTFSTVTGTDAGSGLTFVPIYNANNVTLDVQ